MTLFHIYGDNVVECSRTLDYIMKGFPRDTIVGSKKDFTNITTPTFYLKARINDKEESYAFKFFPGTNATRWNKDIYKEFVLDRGGLLREGADALITKVEDGHEIPLLALEFSAALAAGNNAWQRSGRAISLDQANIPYFYLVHIGGKELKKDGTTAERYSNPSIPFSFSLNTLQNDSQTMFVYSPAPEADISVISKFENCYGDLVFSEVLYKLINNMDYQNELDILNEKNIEFLKVRSSFTNKISFDADDYDLILEDSNPYDKLIEVTKSKKTSWNKKLKKEIKDQLPETMIETLETISDYAYSFLTKDIPICLIPKELRTEFAKDIEEIYSNKLGDDFKEWLYEEDDLVICVVNGFKPRGDDSRPDRGLLPLAKMLTNRQVLTIVYGTAAPSMWEKLEDNPQRLLKENGLWTSILNFSEGILVDSPTRSDFPTNAYYKTHWAVGMTTPVALSTPEEIYPFPRRTGEQDVDSAIHLLFNYSGIAFESSCNPPGGDWSGISLVKEDLVYRWTSLNRVSGVNSKRPDHIYQLKYQNTDTLLIVESKGIYAEVIRTEKNVGPNMTEYLTKLLSRPSNAKKKIDTDWQSCNDSIDIDNYNLITAVAYKLRKPIEDHLSEMQDLILYTNVELVFALELRESCSILHIFSANKIIHKFAEYIQENFSSSQLPIQIYK